MRKIVAAVTALLCVMGCMAYVPVGTYDKATSVSITASAVDIKNAEPGLYADQYTYKYADTMCYSNSIAALKIETNSKDENIAKAAQTLAGADGKGFEASESGQGGVQQSFYNEQGYALRIYSVTVMDGTDKVMEYHVGLCGIKETILDLKVNEIEVPDAFGAYAKAAGIELADAKHVTMIADSAFTGKNLKNSKCYLKTIDMTGVQFIGKAAFSGAAYITEITIPKTVKFVGENAFENSGLKTLTINNEMPVVPASLCAGTKLTTITFAHPEMIRMIDKRAFAKTPIGEPIFNSWGAAKGYEAMLVNESAYEGCDSISAVIMPDNLYLLSKSVFKNCTKLSSIDFGKSTIGADAECFSGCISLDTINFTPSVRCLGGAVFANCTALKKVVGMPDALTDWVESKDDPNTGWGFGNNMFANDTSLVSVELPKSITKIPEGAFMNCTALTSVYNNDNIIEVAKNGFRGCTSLLEADYPKLEKVQESGFEDCSGMLAAKYPKLTYIGMDGFKGCSKMSSFEVGECTEVGNNAMEGCTGLTSITLLSKQYGKYVFKGCTGATKIKVNGAAMEMIPEGTFTECSALKTVDADLSKTSIIGPSAFSKCTSLEKTQFSSVRIIETSAFADCTSLVSVTSGGKPIAAEDYGAKCFQNCTSLAIDIDGTISTIGANAFENSGIKKVNLDGMTGGTVVIGASAFAKCPNLTDAKISASKVAEFSIGSGIFSDAAQLQKAVYDGPIITQNMFKNCVSLKEVDTNATSIQMSAFEGCTMLEGLYNVDHSKNLIAKDIASNAFSKCENLKVAPSDEKTVFSGAQQYAGCTSLTSIKTDVLTSGMFNGCTSLSDVTVTGSKSIPNDCFKDCTSLAKYDFTGVIEVGKNAFMNSGITAVEIDSAQTIGSTAFQNCASLKSVDINTSTIEANAFNNCSFIEKAVICADTIGANAFAGCASMKELTLQTSESHKLSTIGANAFSNCNILYEVIVPGSPKIEKNAFGFVNSKVNADFVLVGESGSSVQEYADSSQVAFEDVSSFDLAARQKTRHTLGDVDGNSVISTVDVVKMQSWLLKKATPGLYSENMDLNKDGVVDVFDLSLLKRKLTS